MPPLPKKQKLISLDTETTGIDFKHGARPYLVTICNEAGQNTWWEWDVNPLTRKPIVPRADLFEIQAAINEADGVVLQNPKFDYKALLELFAANRVKFTWDWDKVFDTLMAGHLLASNQPHDLTSMVLVYLGVNIQPYEDAIEVAVNEAKRMARSKQFQEEHPGWRLAKKGEPDMPSAKEKTWKFDMWLPRALAKLNKYPADHPWWNVCNEYANPDSASTLPLFIQQRKILKEKGLWEIYLERLKVLPSIAGLEQHGLTMIDSHTDELEKQYLKTCAKLHKTCVELSGGKLDKLPKNGASNALKSVLFDQFKLTSSKTTPKGNASVDKFVIDEWLTTLPDNSNAYEFISCLKGYRKRQTALGYITSYRSYQVASQIPGYSLIYSNLNPTGTDTLRFSSENPNGQQISKQEIEEEGEEGHSARYMFGPEPGREWWAMDYENIELRIPGYESNERCMVDLFEKPDDAPFFGSYHLLNASIIYPDLFWPLADQKGAFKEKYADSWYQWVKNFGFAFSYGCMEATGDRTAHKPGAYNLVKDRLKEHSKLNAKMVAMANKCGYVETIPDVTVNPKRGYPIWCSYSKWGRGVAPTIPLNYHVQSTAMWSTMKAMTRCYNFIQKWNRAAVGAVVDGIVKVFAGEVKLVLQVHDEIVFDLPKGGTKNLPLANKLRSLMEQSGNDIGIPLRVAISYHPNNWGTKEKVKEALAV